MDLFSGRTSYLHIIHNDRVIHDEPMKLFDPSLFKELMLVTYVTSPEFFYERIKDFKKVIAILGEEETARQFYQIDPLIEERFIRQAEQYAEILHGLDTGAIELRYMKAGERIHSKIYILKDGEEKFLRVMVGSANFTLHGFGNKAQYEELIVYDSNYNKPFCDAYLRRFEDIYKNSADFLSEKTRKKIKALVLRTENVFILSPDERAEVTIEKINREKLYGGDATGVVLNVIEEKETLEKRVMEIERIERIVEHVTKKTKDGHSFEPLEKLRSLKEKLKEIVSFSHRRSQEFIDKRRFLHFNPVQSEFFVKHSDVAVPFTSSLGNDELRTRLVQLVNFVESYWEFAVHKDREVLKRVFEAILFAFTSPFIYLMRKAVRKEQCISYTR